MDFEFKEHYDVYDLFEIVKILRSPEGCPWDKVQTHETIRSEFIEEVYEAVEAIDEKDPVHLREELGDVLLQVVFHCVLENEKNSFELDDVADDVCKKMILRHPHVFGNTTAETPEEVLKNWDQIKMQSKSQSRVSETLESVSKALPSLMRSDKLIKRAERAGFANPDARENISAIRARLDALEAAVENGGTDECGREIGELLFSVSRLSRSLKTDCEKSLYDACDRFTKQFSELEAYAAENGIDIQKSDPSELSALWDAVSKQSY